MTPITSIARRRGMNDHNQTHIDGHDTESWSDSLERRDQRPFGFRAHSESRSYDRLTIQMDYPPTARSLMRSLQGRRVIVSGGASGIGQATSLKLCAAGAEVAVLDVDVAAGRPLERTRAGRRWPDSVPPGRRLRRGPGGRRHRRCHRVAGWPRRAHRDRGHHARSAGGPRGTTMWPRGTRSSTSTSRGAFLGAKHAAHAMLAAGHGVIVLVGSKAGVSVGSGSFSYGASKGGIHGLAMALDRHLGPRGIRVNELCPGDVDTPLYRRSVAGGRRAWW